ncbi:hypothetical protein A2W13_02445 [Candidatus Woesebacteria bacterium RBG_16_36_11]|uniref:DUF4012 domain-containing protein n=3 Tax=Candidatus Woeseibacteriota TaxID=1752722 RepID=A0A1F7X9K3_9BACT|nr:MAG: hypothetical protein A2Z67_01100 [Candidatus Woesebacteria bacterium RBG_13_36_22]OGM11701.1 MAG: hypothetical protein A2W13_02445 [Candidatus Woesebacteria bacterium RBG_16_36_11]OGM16445.1 MAG: hypothetical protein A2V55_03095 [Candidatus Woesebacteria bacterium RBG_19FT_COMBO_37_29]
MPEETIPQIKPNAEEEKPILDTIKINKPEKKAEKATSQMINKSPRKKIVFGVLGFLLIFIVILGLLFLNVYLHGRKVLTNIYKVQESVKLQDIQKMKTDLGDFKTSLISLKSSYNLISWMKFIPFLGGYIGDGQHFINAGIYGTDLGQITLDTIEPYSDLIGLKGAKTYGDGGKTAADRVDFIVKTLPSLLPKMDEIAAKADLVRNEIDNVNPNRYPEKIAGKPLRATLEKGIDLVDSATKLITNGKPLLENTPYLLGLDSPRTYLILFQNDKELRPTGGFMTAYSIMKVDKAKFEPVNSNDIYNLDAKYKPSIPAPDPIVKYIKGPYIISKNLRLRDMNWSPDFSQSMDLFTQEAEIVGVKDIDGIIAVDTQLLVYLLDAIGPIGVPGFGNFSTKQIPECNCPQVIYELESFADVEGPIVWDPVSGKIIYKPPNSDNRKKIIGPLMNSIMSNALGQPKEKIPALFEAGFKSMMEKHVLFFLFDQKTQQGVASFGIGGIITDTADDYLLINDANLGGRKSNLYVTQEVSEEIKIAKDGSVEKTLTISYKNPEKYDGWLNSVLPNWVRIYVPKGSELITLEGVEDSPKPYEEFNKTVFAGFFELRPLGITQVTVKYKLPFKVKDVYKYYIQKQPGKDAPLYTIKIGKTEEEFLLKTDKEMKFRI